MDFEIFVVFQIVGQETHTYFEGHNLCPPLEVFGFLLESNCHGDLPDAPHIIPYCKKLCSNSSLLLLQCLHQNESHRQNHGLQNPSITVSKSIIHTRTKMNNHVLGFRINVLCRKCNKSSKFFLETTNNTNNSITIITYPIFPQYVATIARSKHIN